MLLKQVEKYIRQVRLSQKNMLNQVIAAKEDIFINNEMLVGDDLYGCQQ